MTCSQNCHTNVFTYRLLGICTTLWTNYLHDNSRHVRKYLSLPSEKSNESFSRSLSYKIDFWILRQFQTAYLPTAQAIRQKILFGENLLIITVLIRKHSQVATNGLLLRSDIHLLYDSYLPTVEPESNILVVSKRITASIYGQLDGMRITTPKDPLLKPNDALLEMHMREFHSIEKLTA